MPTPDEYRSLDLEGAAQSGVARSSNALGNTVVVGIPLVALAFVGWLLYSWQHKDAKLMTAADKEEFNTQQYPGPGLPAERPNLDLGRMSVPPPPPPPAEPQVPPPPVAPPTARPNGTMTTRSGGWPKRNARSGSAFGRASSLPTGAPPWRRAAQTPRRMRAAAAERQQPRKTAIVAFWRPRGRPGSKNPSRPRTIASTRSSRRER
jgi:hypothetical protein